MGSRIKLDEMEIEQLEKKIKSQANELENRLESLSKLIQRNEQLSNSLKQQKARFEKFKNEQITSIQLELSDRNNEIEVLKEMLKGNQLQLRAKEREIMRYRIKFSQVEGVQQIQKQQITSLLNNSGIGNGSFINANSIAQKKIPLSNSKDSPFRNKVNQPNR